MLSKQQLVDNLTELQEQLESHLELQEHHHKNALAFQGAIQNCDYLIGLCDEEESSE